LGAVDQITFTPPDRVPAAHRNRRLYAHNPSVTLVRSNPNENTAFGRLLCEKLNRAKGPLTLFIPLRGTSQYAGTGAVFFDPEADEALINSIEAHLDPGVEVVKIDAHINDPDFGLAMAEKLDEHYRTWAESRRRGEEGEAGRDALVTGTPRG